jgi:phosphoribosylglycinamide formyltransferase-1
MSELLAGIGEQRLAISNHQPKISNLVVLISGYGSNLQAILDAAAAGGLPARVAVVISNKKDAYGLERARQAGIPAIYYPKPREQNRRVYDAGLAELAASYRPDWIVLAGWMRVLSSAFLESFPGRVVNLHPALPGMFPGTDAIQRAFEAYQREEIAHTGVMVHLVPDEGVDAGPLLAQEVVPIEPQDTLEALEARVHAMEHRILVETIKRLTTESQPRRH